MYTLNVRSGSTAKTLPKFSLSSLQQLSRIRTSEAVEYMKKWMQEFSSLNITNNDIFMVQNAKELDMH